MKSQPIFISSAIGESVTRAKLEKIAASHNRSVLKHYEYVEHSAHWTPEDDEFHHLYRQWGMFIAGIRKENEKAD